MAKDARVRIPSRVYAKLQALRRSFEAERGGRWPLWEVIEWLLDRRRDRPRRAGEKSDA